MYATLLCLIVAVTATSFAQPPPPPGPPRPILPKSYVSLVSVNYTAFGGSGTTFKGIEHYAVDSAKRVVLNITDNNETFYTTEFSFYDDNKAYQVIWNSDKDKADGTCKSMPLPKYPDLFGWIEMASFTGYNAFLDWETWAYTNDNKTYVLMAVPSMNRNSPITLVVQNQTEFIDLAFLTLEARQPPEDYFSLPSFCNKVSQEEPMNLSINHPPTAMMLSVFDSIVKGGPNVIRGDYTKAMHPVVRQMLRRVIK